MLAELTRPDDGVARPPEPGRALGRHRDRLVLAALAALIAGKLVLLCLYAFDARWVMDEFAQGYLGHTVEQGLYRGIDPIKTALPQLLFGSFLHRDLASAEIHRAWRVATLLAALVVVPLVAAIARRLHGSWLAALFAGFTLLSFSTFLERSFRVRNDTFAVALVVGAMATTLLPKGAARSAWGSGLLVGLAFLCTQKTAYHTAALALAHLLLGFHEQRARGALVRISRFAAGFGVPLLVYAVGFGGLSFPGVLRDMFLSPLAHAALLSQHSEGLGRFVVQTFARNTLAYLLCFVGLGMTVVRWRTTPPAPRAAAVSSATIAVLVFAHQQTWPYVFVMAIPFLALWAPIALLTIPDRRRFGAILAIVLLSTSFARNWTFLRATSASQLVVVREAELLLRPGDRYFDGMGMVPSRHVAGRHPWWWWDRPTLRILAARWRAGDRTEIEAILRDQPKLWILNYRLNAFQGFLGPTWRTATVRVSEFLLLTGCEVRPGRDTPFQNLWTGEYRAYDAQGEPVPDALVVDGVPCAASCRLTAGRHLVATTSAEPRFLLPADFSGSGSLPYEGPVRDLFAGIYSF